MNNIYQKLRGTSIGAPNYRRSSCRRSSVLLQRMAGVAGSPELIWTAVATGPLMPFRFCTTAAAAAPRCPSASAPPPQLPRDQGFEGISTGTRWIWDGRLARDLGGKKGRELADGFGRKKSPACRSEIPTPTEAATTRTTGRMSRSLALEHAQLP